MIFQVVLYTALCEILYSYMNKKNNGFKKFCYRHVLLFFFWKRAICIPQTLPIPRANVITTSLMKAADVIYTTTHQLPSYI